MAEEVEINPTIRGDKVVRLEICGIEWPLKKDIPVEEFLKLTESIRLMAKYVDFKRIGLREGLVKEPWTREELLAFIKERNRAQKVFLKVLAERGEISRDELLDIMRDRLGDPGYGAKDLAGMIAGINIRVNKLGKEHLFTISRRRVGGQLMGFYEINPEYRELLLELLSGEAGE